MDATSRFANREAADAVVADRLEFTLGRVFLEEVALMVLCLWLPTELLEVIRRIGSALGALKSAAAAAVHLLCKSSAALAWSSLGVLWLNGTKSSVSAM